LVFSLLREIHFKLQGKRLAADGVRIKLVVDGEEHARGIQGVGGRAKMPRRVPEEILCSTTDVSIFAALTAYFENKTRYSSFTRAKRHRGHGGRRSRRRFRGAVGSLDFCAELWKAHAKIAPSTAAARINRARIVLRDALIWWGSKRGPLSLRACEPGDHDIVRGHAIVKVQKKTAWKPVKSRRGFLD